MAVRRPPGPGQAQQPPVAPSSMARARANSASGKPPRENLRVELAHQRAIAAQQKHEEVEADLREEWKRLRAAHTIVLREELEVRDKVRRAERESHEKDKLLQDLLSRATTGEGVSDEALDQMREDLQRRLHFKARSFESMERLDEQEAQLAAMRREIDGSRGSSTKLLEEEVMAAKAEAKQKAQLWLQAKDAQGAADLRQLRADAQGLLAQIAEAQAQVTRSHGQVAHLGVEAENLGREAAEHEEQRRLLEKKRSEVQPKLGTGHDVPALKAKQAELEKEVAEKDAELLRLQKELGSLKASLPKVPPRGVHHRLLEEGFTPLRGDSDPDLGQAIWRLRQALAIGGHSAVSMLGADAPDRRLISVQDLGRVLQQLKVCGAAGDQAKRLFAALDSALVPQPGQASALDLALALPLQPKPAGPEAAEVAEAADALMWACRRRGTSEAEVRNRLLHALDAPGLRLEAEVKQLLDDLGLEERFLAPLALGLEVDRERFLHTLPSWRCPSSSSRTALRKRFVDDLAARLKRAPALVRPATAEGAAGSPLEELLGLGGELGPAWSELELEEVALAAEVGAAPGEGAPPSAGSGPPVVTLGALWDEASALSDAGAAGAADAAPPLLPPSTFGGGGAFGGPAPPPSFALGSGLPGAGGGLAAPGGGLLLGPPGTAPAPAMGGLTLSALSANPGSAPPSAASSSSAGAGAGAPLLGPPGALGALGGAGALGGGGAGGGLISLGPPGAAPPLSAASAASSAPPSAAGSGGAAAPPPPAPSAPAVAAAGEAAPPPPPAPAATPKAKDEEEEAEEDYGEDDYEEDAEESFEEEDLSDEEEN